ncbi:MAG TPA: YbhB/YbcL family Raf kinase inhibitor-like protein [Azospira sp.]|nr:YbhB/YbcL family Raf kinase inhibitor-like protein [Azospira sp.]HNN46191.1 YbhB/YbcL family Raf kinase inhibitor-like protein [Azospira sp.]
MITRTGIAMLLCACAGSVHAAGFALSSPDIKPKATIKAAQVFNGFGCTGENISPALVWKNPPKGTKSFALQVHDPDAPTGGSGWWHWVVINIPAATGELPSGAGKADGSGLPAGAIQINTDFGGPGWGGPCPPVGDTPHRYNFTLHALKVEKLELPPGATAALAGYMINANSIGKAKLTGLYGRKK